MTRRGSARRTTDLAYWLQAAAVPAAQGEPHPRPLQAAAGGRAGVHGRGLLRQAGVVQLRRAGRAPGACLSEVHYYRAGPPTSPRRPPRRRRRRRSVWPRVLAVVAVVAVVAIVLVAVPWFGHLGLPWPGGGATAEGSSGTPGATPTATVSGITIATDEGRHDGKVLVRFTTADGDPVAAQWRVDGGDWHTGKIAYVAAPKDHSRDGDHVMEVRATGGGSTVKYTVIVDTAAPDVTWITAKPDRIDGPARAQAGLRRPRREGRDRGLDRRRLARPQDRRAGLAAPGGRRGDHHLGGEGREGRRAVPRHLPLRRHRHRRRRQRDQLRGAHRLRGAARGEAHPGRPQAPARRSRSASTAAPATRGATSCGRWPSSTRPARSSAPGRA